MPNPILSRIPAAVLAALLAYVAATDHAEAQTRQAAFALQSSDINDGPERINFAAKLDMHSQRLAAAACNINAGTGGIVAQGYLRASAGEFERILSALQRGDPFIGIVRAEENARILRRVMALRDLFASVQTDAPSAFGDGAGNDTAADLLVLSRNLTSELAGHYANPSALLSADALTLELMGRARTLPQVLSARACALAATPADARDGAALNADIELYDRMLDALRHGHSDVGVAPPSDADITAELDRLIAQWSAIRPDIVALAQGADGSGGGGTDMFAAMNDLTTAMNDIAALKAQTSKVEIWSRPR